MCCGCCAILVWEIRSRRCCLNCWRAALPSNLLLQMQMLSSAWRSTFRIPNVRHHLRHALTYSQEEQSMAFPCPLGNPRALEHLGMLLSRE